MKAYSKIELVLNIYEYQALREMLMFAYEKGWSKEKSCYCSGYLNSAYEIYEKIINYRVDEKDEK